MTTKGMPDWASLWDEGIRNSSWIREILRQAPSMVEYWDKHSAKYVKGDSLCSTVLSRIEGHITPETEILDVGAGTGAFAIPLARKAQAVTAVEPSTGMLAYLKNRARQEGLTNIECINTRWQEVDLIRRYDVVVCANALPFMTDIRMSLRKMLDAANRSLWLLLTISERGDILDEIWSIVREEPYEPGPDYSWLYNLLREFGTHPHVEIFASDRRFTSLDEAVKFMTTHCAEGATDGKEEKLRTCISRYLERSEDGSFLWRKLFKTALLVVYT